MDARQLRALDLLLAGRPLAEVAREAGVDRQQVMLWMAEPGFLTELWTRQADRREAVASGLLAGALDAVAFLRAIVRDETAPVEARVEAATALLESARLADDQQAWAEEPPPAPAARREDDWDA